MNLKLLFILFFFIITPNIILCLNIPQLCVCNKIKQSVCYIEHNAYQNGAQTKVNEGYTNYIITSKVVDCSASCVTNGDFGLPIGTLMCSQDCKNKGCTINEKNYLFIKKY
ncbi:hypothetical protein Mgra_00007898 [Meloidogyne graminicola]|uniref:Uncharacterized protein n=1 Tax=Meloidogyne graminicola TaxID=189291 RepID=A0A8S9ZH77_9BILA|nr:hypothetical protein Mgra_00007898 [Meloidogyne graminicola]KAF7632677.1 hypothetical protein Mgra_00007898 [Meloidogyne graminicola]